MSMNQGPLTVTAGEAIAAHRRVISNGTTVSLASGSQTHDGVCPVAIASGSIGPMEPANASGTQWIEASGSVTAGNIVYAAASGMVAETGSVIVGRALNSCSANQMVEVLPVAGWGAGSTLLYASVAESAGNAATSATSYGVTATIPANSLKAGDVIEIEASGIAPTTTSTLTLTNTYLFGSVTLNAVAGPDATNDDIQHFRGVVTIRTVGASGTLVASGTQVNGPAASATAKPFRTASSAIDTTAAIVVDVKATWSGGSCSSTLTQLVVKLHRKAA